MTLTVRSASVTGAVTAGRALTHAEMDANWAHVIQSANQTFLPSGTVPSATTVQAQLRLLGRAPQNHGAAGDGVTDDTTAIQNCFNSGSRVFVPNATYKLSSKVSVPAGLVVYFDDATFIGHFNDFMLLFKNLGKQKFIGKLTLKDTDPSVVSSATTLTKGIQFGITAEAIHNVDTTGCTIRCEQLKQSYYFGEFSWTNTYGVLESFNCGDAATYAVFCNNDSVNYPNNTKIQNLKVTGSNISAWAGKGALLDGRGCSIDQFDCESNFAADACTIAGTWSINGGYLEGTTGTNQITVSSTGAAVFTGTLINCDLVLNNRTPFVGCRFLTTTLHKNATYLECKFPNANQLRLDVTGFTVDQLPLFGSGSSPAKFASVSGHWSEFGTGYTVVPIDFDYFGGNHTVVSDSAVWSGSQSAKFTKTPAGTNYAGAVGWKLPKYLATHKIYAWAILKTPSGAGGVSQVRVGVGGILDTGSSDANYINTVTQAAFADKWVLVVLPLAALFTSATYTNNAYFFFEPSNEAQNAVFNIDSFGVEIGGLTYHNLGDVGSQESYLYRRATAAPATGAWVVGDRFAQLTPVVGNPKGWQCTVAGSPGTWVSEGNL